MDLEQLLRGVKDGSVSVASAAAKLKSAPYVELGAFAKLDTHRGQRTGMSEVVFCQGKADDHLLAICQQLLALEGNFLGTRCSPAQATMLKKEIPNLYYDPLSGIISTKEIKRPPLSFAEQQAAKAANTAKTEGAAATALEASTRGEGLICVVTAGTADLKVAEEAALTCEFFGGKVHRIYDAGVSGLHRLLAQIEPIQAANCTIAIAGMEGALASVLGGLVSHPVIAVPTSVGYGANFHGLSALLTMLNSCSNGVCTVNIDNGFGAAFLATQINRLACHGGASETDLQAAIIQSQE